MAKPQVAEFPNIRDFQRLEDEQEWLVINAHVTRVGKSGKDRVEMALVIVDTRVGLLDQCPPRRPIPDARPARVRPSDAEGEVGFATRDDLLDGSLEKLTPSEPVMPIAEALYAVLARQFRLCDSRFCEAQVVVAQVRREAWLIVAWVQAAGPGHVGPLGKAPLPRRVVFGHGVELRQMQGNQARTRCRWPLR